MHAVLWSLALSKVFQRLPVTFTVKRKLIPLWSQLLSASVTSFRLPNLSAGSCSQRFLAPLSVSPELAPCEAGYHSRSGSALRLSQPLSGFLADSGFAALFRAATNRGVLSFRAFPSQKSRTSLEAAGSLAVIDQRAATHPSEPCHRRFHRLPRSRAVA